jgi:hypothetical protein
MDATRSANDGSFSPQNALALSIRKDAGAVWTSGASPRIFLFLQYQQVIPALLDQPQATGM